MHFYQKACFDNPFVQFVVCDNISSVIISKAPVFFLSQHLSNCLWKPINFLSLSLYYKLHKGKNYVEFFCQYVPHP